MSDFNIDTMTEWALDFSDNGYCVMPLYGVDKHGQCLCMVDVCDNQYKHPKIKGWSQMRAQTPDQIEALFNANVFKESYGIVLDDETLVVDFDPRNNENALEELNAMLGMDIKAECNFIVKSGSGGLHLYFKKPAAFKTVKVLKEIAGIDFLSKGSFVVGCGSKHKSGYCYEAPEAAKRDILMISEAPEALLMLIERKEVIRESAYESGSSTEDELRSALNAIPNDENTDYEFWLNIGMALAYETDNSDNGYALWEEWSEKSIKHDGSMMIRKWESFRNIQNISNPRTAGTIFKYAHDNGWEQDYNCEIDLSEFMRRFEEGKAVKTVLKNAAEDSLEIATTPDELQRLPGILGEVVEYILSTAKYPLYMPSLNASIAFCSVVLGRDFTTDYENYTALYLMSVAETGAGKEHPYKVISKILNAAGQGRLLKGEVTGKSAIVTELYSNPRALFVKDEMAHWLEVIGSKTASENKKLEVKAWLEIFSKCESFFSSDSYTALSEILKGKVDEASESSITIQKPSVSLLGMTTPQKLSESMTKMMISEGLLNRFIVMFAQEGDQKMNNASKPRPVPQSILSWIETIERRVLHHNRNKSGRNRNLYGSPMAPIELKFSQEAFNSLDAYEDKILARKQQLRRKGLELMIVRDREKAMRLSLIVELAKDPYSNEISKASTDFAISLVDFCFEQMIKYIEFEMVENGIDKRYKEAYNVIESYGTDGILQKDLMKMSPFKSTSGNVHKEILAYLMDQTEQIVAVRENKNKRGRPSVRLYASKFVSYGEEDGSTESD